MMLNQMDQTKQARLTSAMLKFTAAPAAEAGTRGLRSYFLRCMLSTSVRYQVPGNRWSIVLTG